MTDKQPDALRMADYWEGRAKELQPWIDDNEFTEFGYRPEGLKREQEIFQQAAAELRRLHEVNAELVETLAEIAEWTERYTTPGHPISTVARAALAKATGENNG